MSRISEGLSYQSIGAIAAQTELKVYDVLKLLAILVENTSVENNLLVQATGIPKTHMGRILSAMSSFLEPPSRQVIIKKEMREDLLQLLDTYYYHDDQVINKRLQNQVDEIAQYRPKAQRDFDQFIATDATLIRRAHYLQEQGELLQRKILFLGDDDHTSIAIASIAQHVEITVIDVDSRMLESISSIAKRHRYPITTIHHDVRNPLLAHLNESYDMVFTDPPYTEAGVSVFINQGITALSKKQTSRLYFCYSNSDRARERELQIQSQVTEQGLLIQEKQYQFNRYQGAESIGSASSLWNCKLTPKTQITHQNAVDIYTNS